jgi:tricorn protease-like protein
VYTGSVELGGAAFSRDGRRIVVGGQDGRLRIVNLDGSGPVLEFGRDSSPISSVGFSPDGRYVVSGRAAGTVVVTSVPGLASELPRLLVGHTDDVLSATYSPDGKLILSSSFDKTARLWSAEGGLLGVVTGHRDAVRSAAFSPDGKVLVTGSLDGVVRLWLVEAPERVPLELSGHQGGVLSVAFAPDGHRVVSASADTTAWVWGLDINPDVMRRQLWLATPYCVPVAVRRRIMNVPEEEAGQAYASCAEMVRCLDEGPRQGPEGVVAYRRCLDRFHRAQELAHRQAQAAAEAAALRGTATD